MEAKIRVAKTNKENDTANKLLKKCKLPDSNNQLIKNGFDPEILFEETKDLYYANIHNLQFLNDEEHPNHLFISPPESGKEQLAMLIGIEACKNGYSTHYVYYCICQLKIAPLNRDVIHHFTLNRHPLFY